MDNYGFKRTGIGPDEPTVKSLKDYKAKYKDYNYHSYEKSIKDYKEKYKDCGCRLDGYILERTGIDPGEPTVKSPRDYNEKYKDYDYHSYEKSIKD